MELLIVRHGQSKANRDNIHQWRYDTPLTKQWRQQAALCGKALAKAPIDHIYTSDLLRAKETAQIVHTHTPSEHLSERKQLRERKSGLGGTKKELLLEQYDVSIETFYDQVVPNHPASEDHHELYKRAENVLQEVSDRHDKERILFVSHGGFLSMLLHVANRQTVETYTGERVYLHNASISKLSYQEEIFTVNFTSKTDHLQTKEKSA